MIIAIDELATRLSNSSVWDFEDCRLLCTVAGLQKEFDSADGEAFDSVVYAAANLLGVVI